MDEIGKLLPAIFRGYLQREAPRVVEVLAPLWPHVVGKAVAQHSRPAAFERGTLRLAASCPSWGVQLRRMSEEIRTEVNRYLGCMVVKKITVRHDSLHDKSRVDASKGRNVSCTAAWENTLPDPPRPARSSRPRQLQVAPPPPGRQLSSVSFSSAAGTRNLAPEVARILELSFAKYFSRAALGTPGRKLN